MAYPACNCSVSNLCWGVSSAIVEGECSGELDGDVVGRDSKVCPRVDQESGTGISRNHIVQSKRLTITIAYASQVHFLRLEMEIGFDLFFL